MNDSLPATDNPRYHPSDDGFVDPGDRKPENSDTAALRAEVEALRAQLAIQAPREVSADNTDERTFPKGTLVHEVHEFDRLEAERRLLQAGLKRSPEPLPEGTVTATEADFGRPSAS